MSATQINKLRDITIKNAKPKEKPYPLSDGQSLYIEIMPNGGKYWRLRYRYAGKQKRIALGVYPEVSIKEAREAATKARELVRNGTDPLDAKKQDRLNQHLAATNSFEAIAHEWFDKEAPSWSETHKVRVERYKDKYLIPYIGNRPIKEITAPELLAVVRKKEAEGSIETAHRVNRVAGQIFRYAIQTGRAENDPSHALKGALRKPVTTHFAAAETPKELKPILIAVDNYEGSATVKAYLQLIPLFFVRPGALRTLKWQQINWEESYWQIPTDQNTKIKTDHRVPMARQAIQILRFLQRLNGKSEYVFRGERSIKEPISDNAGRTALRIMGFSKEQVTLHGFRATAKTMLDEVLGYPFDYIEHQLAHTIREANGRAYNRTSYWDKRKAMMQNWADYLDSLKTDDKVIVDNFRYRP